MNEANTSVAVIDAKSFSVRTNKAGRVMGQRVSFLSEYPAGDVRKALKAKGIQGKALTAAVNAVIRDGEKMANVAFDAAVSYAKASGFIGLKGDLNKAGDKLTLVMVKPKAEAPADPVKTAESLTDEQLMAILEARKAAKSN